MHLLWNTKYFQPVYRISKTNIVALLRGGLPSVHISSTRFSVTAVNVILDFASSYKIEQRKLYETMKGHSYRESEINSSEFKHLILVQLSKVSFLQLNVFKCTLQNCSREMIQTVCWDM